MTVFVGCTPKESGAPPWRWLPCSRGHGPLASVFLGSRASKILRYAPVPVMALPRAQA
jgi:nucleotide-binding universal stress UspA family protein